jgi:hypothetical protein
LFQNADNSSTDKDYAKSVREVDTNIDGVAAVSPVGDALGEYIGLSQARLVHICMICNPIFCSRISLKRAALLYLILILCS